jgi:hypothetical protein
MAVYKIFPSKDATIYSRYPNKNTGLDEILSVSIEDAQDSGNTQASRILIQFSDEEITNVFNNLIEDANWNAYLRLFSSVANGLNGDTTIGCYMVTGSWNMGTGKYAYNPEYINGVSWYARFSSGSGNWQTNGYPPGVTGSYGSIPGGGNWYTNHSTFQTFSYYDNKDLNLDISAFVELWFNEDYKNNGLIVKQVVEFVDDIQYNNTLEYFSRDTHTIYPPQLEFKWDDFSFNTGSLLPLTTTEATISIDENPGIFYPESINKFRVNARPEYPTRIYQTASYYVQTYYLPTASYYAIKDLDTNEYVIDFDETYTKLSCDPNGNYFNLYLNGLEPERYYSILIKTTINGSTIVFDNNYNFKVINA